MLCWFCNVKCIDSIRYTLYPFLCKGPAGPIGTPGVRGEDGNPGPRVREILLLLKNVLAKEII